MSRANPPLGETPGPGGIEPVWSSDGTEFAYRSGAGLVSVRFTGEEAFAVESRTPLFELGEDNLTRIQGRAYDVHRSAGRSLFVQDASSSLGGD